MIIDIHAHYPVNEADFPQRLVRLMPEAGIDKIVLFSAGEPFGHASNEQILHAAQQFPERIIPFAFIRLGHDTPADVDRYVREGFRGFKITTPAGPYDDERFLPLYERMERSGLPLLAHTGIVMRFPQPPGMRVNSNWMRPVCLDEVVRTFPKLNVIGAHLGVPWHDEASTMARMHPNYYLDLTGACHGGWRLNKDAEFFRKQFFWEGAWDKVLFGTDILALDELVPARRFHDRMLAPLNLPPDVMAKIYGGTAQRLLGLRP